MNRSEVMRDVLASLVVFLVALPLCMGIALASGVPPAMGLLAGIVGGLVVGALGGAPLQVSGPAAGLTVIVYDIVQDHGIGVLLVVVFAAGLLQIAAGYLKMGRWFRAVPHSVVYGMLAGIGVLIFASQFHAMVDDEPAASGLTNLLTIPRAVLKGLTPEEGTVHHLAAGIGILTLVITVGWNALRKRLPGALGVLPAPLLAVTSATIAAEAMALPIKRVQVPESAAGFLHLMQPELLVRLAEPAILGLAIAMAVVASAETMLCATAVDKLHDGERTDFDKELKAQGVGNALLGVLGGLPITGVIVRSSANIDAGGRSRLSAILHGVWLVVALLAFPGLLRAIPIASLAAVLVHIGWRLVNVRTLVSLYRQNRAEFAICLVTMTAIVVTNLLEGLLIGLGLAVARLAWVASHLHVETEETEAGVFHVRLHGAATFVNLPRLAEALERLPQEAEVHVHLEHLSYVDHAALETIRDWERQREPRGGRLVLEWDELHRKAKPAAHRRSTSAEGAPSPPRLSARAAE